MRLERHEAWVDGSDAAAGASRRYHYRYWLLVGPTPPGARAITIWSLIVVRERALGDRRLLRHELVHVHQWHEHGPVGFLARYLGAYLRQRARLYPHWAAYRRIPFEIEADWHARRTASRAGPPLR